MLQALVISKQRHLIEELKLILKTKGIVILSEFDEYRTYLQQILEDEIDIIFLDMDFEEIQSLKIVQTIKERQLSTQVIVIANGNDSAVKFCELFAAHYITNPLCKEQLETTIENVKKNNLMENTLIIPFLK